MASIDEAYLDLSGTERLHGPSIAAAHKLLSEITRTTGFPCSGGLASTRLVAKVASDQAKPRGLLCVPAGAEAIFLAPLGVRRIPGIGKVTEAISERAGNFHSWSISCNAAWKNFRKLSANGVTRSIAKSRGEDAFEFFLDAEPKSISHNHTFGVDTDDTVESSHYAQPPRSKAPPSVCAIRASAAHRHAHHSLFRIFAPPRMPELFLSPPNLDSVILAALRELFDARWQRTRKVRLLGVALSHFTHGEAAARSSRRAAHSKNSPASPAQRINFAKISASRKFSTAARSTAKPNPND